MTQPLVTVRAATKRDSGAVVEVMSQAFHDTELFRWLMPDDAKRHQTLGVTFGASMSSLPSGHHNNEVAVLGGRIIGAAAWAAPGRWKAPWWRTIVAVPRILRELDREAIKLYAERGPLVDKATKAAHPKTPHWYLAALAVAPEMQGRGAAGVLVRSGQQRARRDAMPIYVECEHSKVRFYERHGFQFLHDITTGAGAPDQVGMWWDDHSAA